MVEKNPYPLDVLEFSLEDRKQFINDHDEEMKYICSSLSHYYEDLKHAVELEFTHSVASHLTYNLVLTLAKGLTSLTIYEYVYGAYLLDDDYNSVYEIWESVYNSANEIIPLLAKLEEENYFDEDIDVDDFLSDIVPPYCLKVKGSEKLLNLHRKVSLKTGHSLIYCLNYYLQTMVNWLNDLKRGVYKFIEGDYDRVYLANYELYRKYYWPNEGRNFRAHIEKYIPSYERLSSEYLARLLNEERSNFEHTDTGMLWRDYFEDKKDLYFEAKRLNLKEKQWKYFFNCICRFEEYERWINELRNPKQEENDCNDVEELQGELNKKVVMIFTDKLLSADEPSHLYFLMLAMWARRLLQSKEIPAFVRMVGEAYPNLFNEERTIEKVIMSLQNMNGKAGQYFDLYVKDQATMIGYIDMMYPKKSNGERRKDCERAVTLANNLFLALK